MGKRCAIFDIDGTLADCTHRLHHVKHGRRDWGAFNAKMGDDQVRAPIRDLAVAVATAQYELADVVVCSGRSLELVEYRPRPLHRPLQSLSVR